MQEPEHILQQARPADRPLREIAGSPAPTAEPDAGAELWKVLASSDADRQSICTAWLLLQCRMMPGAKAALLFLRNEKKYEVAASWPEKHADVEMLSRVADRALAEGSGVFAWGRSSPSSAPQTIGVFLAQSIGVKPGVPPLGVVALHVVGLGAAAALDPRLLTQHLRWGVGWLESFFWQEKSRDADIAATRTNVGLDLIALAAEQTGLTASAMAIANELAVRLRCDRVSIGLNRKKRGGGIRLLAMSHSASFQRKSQIVDALESAMEEGADQSACIMYPTPPSGGLRRINVAHRYLAEASGAQACVASVGLIGRGGRIIGAVTFERHRDEKFESHELLLCEAIAALIGPFVDMHVDGHRLFGGRLVDMLHDGVRTVFESRRPSLRIGAVLAAVLLLVLALAKEDHRVAAKSVLEGLVQRAVAVPFDGFVLTAPRRAGDLVKEGDVLATLDDKDLVLERAKWMSEREQLLQKQRTALAGHDRSEVAVLTAQVEQAASQVALAEDKLSRTRFTAPFDGIVVSGDLSQLLGSPVERGKVLFEIAPLDAYRVVLQVDERDLRYVEVGQAARLALAGMPSSPLALKVTKIVPVSQSEEGRNFFRVEAEFDEPARINLRPGMEGIAKIVAGRRSLIWIWTHDAADWVRLTAWKWLP